MTYGAGLATVVVSSALLASFVVSTLLENWVLAIMAFAGMVIMYDGMRQR